MQWWQWLLVITGGFFLAIFFVVYFGWLYIKHKLSKFGTEFAAGLRSMGQSVLPQTMTLAPPSEPVQESPTFRATIEAVRSLGFYVAGPLVAEEGPGVVVYTTADPAREVCGTVMSAPDGNAYVDFVSLYEDGTSITHSSLPDQGFEQPTQRPSIRALGVSPAELLRRHLAERPDGARLAVQLADVPSHIKRTTEEVYFWRALRRGLTDAELQRQFAMSRAKESPDADPQVRQRSEEMVRMMVRSQASAFLEKRFREQFLEESNLSAQRWEDIEDRILFIFDAADPEQFTWIFQSDEPEQKQLPGESDRSGADLIGSTAHGFEAGSLRQAFARRLAQLPPERRPERIGQVTIRNPLAEGTADVYVRPKSPDEAD